MTAPALRLIVCLAIVASVGGGAGSGLRAQPSSPSIFNGRDLTGWTVDRTPATVDAGVLTVRRGLGWVRFNKVLANFILRMDVRVAEPSSRAWIFVRSWPTFDEKLNVPNNGYRVVAGASRADGAVAGRMVGHGRSAKEMRFDRTAAPIQDDGWHHYDIECRGDSVRVSLDGRVVTEVAEIQNPQGFVALRTDAGTMEFRNISLEEMRKPKPDARAGVFTPADGVVLPRVLHDEKPNYTSTAMQRQIQGTVLLSAVVTSDGAVTDVSVVQSLDPEFGLDNEAINAVKRWKFAPGTRDGQPVSVLVTFELAFTLK